MANILGQIFKNGAEKLVSSIGEAIDRNITSKDEREKNNIELQKIITTHIQEMEKQSNEVFRLEIQDRDSARKMQMAALAQNDLFSKRYTYYLASFIVISATAFGIGLFFYSIPEENKRMIEMFADIYLFSGALVVINFFFGSSKGSHDKDSIIKESLNK